MAPCCPSSCYCALQFANLQFTCPVECVVVFYKIKINRRFGMCCCIAVHLLGTTQLFYMVLSEDTLTALSCSPLS